MEVHHHAHTTRKKWTHYVWEFLMLFLAVFCGFLAENYREHYIEHQREKQYMKAMLVDLKSDSVSLHYLLNEYYPSQKKWIDSSFILLNSNKILPDERLYYQAFENAHFWLGFKPVTRTITELKSTGNFRIIRNQAVKDGIIRYDNTLKEAESFVAEMTNIQNAADTFQLAIADYKIVSQLMEKGFFAFITDVNLIPREAKLVSYDKTLFLKYRKMLEAVCFREAIVFGIYKYYIQENKNLIELLKKEYRLNK